MSTRPDQHESARHKRHASLSEVEALAEDLVALVDEFEKAIAEGRVPRAFVKRLAQLRQTAERLFDA